MFFNLARNTYKLGTKAPLRHLQWNKGFQPFVYPLHHYSTDHAKKSLTEGEHIFDTKKKLSTLVKEWAGKEKPLENTLVLGIQHLLETTGDMLQVMKDDLGLKHAILAGKSYSTHLPTVDRIKKMGFQVLDSAKEYPLCLQDFDLEMDQKALRIWLEAFNQIKEHKFDQFIIIDDGTHVIRSTPGKLFNGLQNKPDSVVGIEQTKGGANGGANNYSKFLSYPFPRIHVGGSYVKNCVEYSHVADVALKHIIRHAEQHVNPDDIIKQTVGIFGYGSLGKELVRSLSEKGFSVNVYDTDKSKLAELIKTPLPNVDITDHPSALVSSNDIIIGATGQDVSALEGVMAAFTTSKTPKLVYSTGSGAYEFATLLTQAQLQLNRQYKTPDPLTDVVYKNKNTVNIIVARSGCPMNFQNTAHSVPPEYIWPTRAALLGAVLTAKQLGYEKQNPEEVYEGIYTLPVNMQKDILTHFAQQTQSETLNHLLSQPKDVIDETIIEGSVGKCKTYDKDAKSATTVTEKKPLTAEEKISTSNQTSFFNKPSSSLKERSQDSITFCNQP
ncbi:MAG: NAD(P)-binding domain-containing protein [Gammaproteobacteria bacterium]